MISALKGGSHHYHVIVLFLDQLSELFLYLISEFPNHLFIYRESIELPRRESKRTLVWPLPRHIAVMRSAVVVDLTYLLGSGFGSAGAVGLSPSKSKSSLSSKMSLLVNALLMLLAGALACGG